MPSIAGEGLSKVSARIPWGDMRTEWPVILHSFPVLLLTQQIFQMRNHTCVASEQDVVR